MKPTFKCEVCERTHGSAEDALACETSHNIIQPKMFWLIPFVGIFAITYEIFSKKNAILIWGEEFKWRVFNYWVAFNPILILTGTLCLIMYFETK